MAKLSEEKRAVLLATFIGVLGFLYLAGLTLVPRSADRDLALLFPFTMNLTEITRELAYLPVDLVRTGIVDNLVVVRIREGAGAEQLKNSGALMVLDAFADGGCVFLNKKRVA